MDAPQDVVIRMSSWIEESNKSGLFVTQDVKGCPDGSGRAFKDEIRRCHIVADWSNQDFQRGDLCRPRIFCFLQNPHQPEIIFPR